MRNSPDNEYVSGWDSGHFPGTVRQTGAQRVAAAIRRLIFEGKLRAGDRVRQEEIADRLGVSRLPVREAIVALDREGWLRAEAHRGAYVTGLDENTVHDHYEILGLVYGLAARRAAERGTPEDLADIRGLAEALGAITDADEFWMANRRFVTRLIGAAHSHRLTAVGGLLTGTIIPGNFFVEIPETLDGQKRATHRVVAAIEAGDGERAERQIVESFRRAGNSAVRLLRDRGVLGG
ncbi:GntR family transcriptional regulator [Cryptosporangium aurantiacum]|uniref:Transcriptional regulator, GntR family n=1 Tax=Cryptosporangium aurantiacum TaxID=134849 RepID=A0A1M7TYC9_9ACTN|nr:GntR family transcriptional regulator [Cryptosporangium aurantiacum]SHN75772.1 transcriptional regulator, GntR family [Cryptosporangium aurantiacum]